eukprot:3140601-Rhodomonas_salina.5
MQVLCIALPGHDQRYGSIYTLPQERKGPYQLRASVFAVLAISRHQPIWNSIAMCDEERELDVGLEGVGEGVAVGLPPDVGPHEEEQREESHRDLTVTRARNTQTLDSAASEDPSTSTLPHTPRARQDETAHAVKHVNKTCSGHE